jgi:hypothetical protein
MIYKDYSKKARPFFVGEMESSPNSPYFPPFQPFFGKKGDSAFILRACGRNPSLGFWCISHHMKQSIPSQSILPSA